MNQPKLHSLDAQGDEDGAVAELAVVADFFVAGIEHQIGTGSQRPVAPFLEFGVQEFGVVADLGGTDGGAAEFLDNGGDFAGGDALDVHFGQGQFEGLLGTEAFFQGAGIEVGVAPDLRDAEGDGADAAGEGLGFVAVGATLASVGALVGLGLEDLMAFDVHGFVDEDAEPFGEAVVALLSQKLQDVVQEFRIGEVGHGVCLLDVLEHPNRKPMWPALDQFFARGASSPLRARLATPHPGGVKTEGRKTNYRRSFTPTSIVSISLCQSYKCSKHDYECPAKGQTQVCLNAINLQIKKSNRLKKGK